MKKLKMICIIWFQCDLAVSASSDSVSHYHQSYAAMYHNLDARLKKSEQKQTSSIQSQREVLFRIERRLDRMEDKFDKYFLWGYGTILSIFIGVLA